MNHIFIAFSWSLIKDSQHKFWGGCFFFFGSIYFFPNPCCFLKFHRMKSLKRRIKIMKKHEENKNLSEKSRVTILHDRHLDNYSTIFPSGINKSFSSKFADSHLSKAGKQNGRNVVIMTTKMRTWNPTVNIINNDNGYISYFALNT